MKIALLGLLILSLGVVSCTDRDGPSYRHQNATHNRTAVCDEVSLTSIYESIGEFHGREVCTRGEIYVGRGGVKLFPFGTTQQDHMETTIYLDMTLEEAFTRELETGDSLTVMGIVDVDLDCYRFVYPSQAEPDGGNLCLPIRIPVTINSPLILNR